MTSTRRTLKRLRAGLVVSTLLVVTGFLAVFLNNRHTVRTVRSDTVPAVVQVASAQVALVAADRAAVRGFLDGDAELAGPGQQYQDQIAVAGQSLAQAAAHNQAGDRGSREIQMAEALLVTYTGLVERADSEFRKPDEQRLGAVHLWSASLLMHQANGGILSQLDGLRKDETDRLAAQRGAGVVQWWTVSAWAVPACVVLLLLARAQVLVSTRFRRTFSIFLVLASGCAVAVPVASCWVLVSEQRLATAQDTLFPRLVEDLRAQQLETDLDGQTALAILLSGYCPAADGCRDTVDAVVQGAEDQTQQGEALLADPRFSSVKALVVAERRDLPALGGAGTSPATAPTELQVTDQQLAAALARDGRTHQAMLAGADRFGSLTYLITGCSGAALALAIAGLAPRIREYRYEAR